MFTDLKKSIKTSKEIIFDNIGEKLGIFTVDLKTVKIKIDI